MTEIGAKRASAMLNVSYMTVLRWAKLGHLRARRDPTQKGRPYLLDLGEIEALVRSRRAGEQVEQVQCSAEGCPGTAISRGLCDRHRHREDSERRNADPSRPLCRWPEGEGCPNKATHRGLCNGHYVAVLYSKEHEWMVPEGARRARCLYPDCDEPQYAQGLCRSHESKATRGTLVPPPLTPLELPLAEAVRMRRIFSGKSLREMGEAIGASGERVRQVEAMLPDALSGRLSSIPPAMVAYLEHVGVCPIDLFVVAVEPDRELVGGAR